MVADKINAATESMARGHVGRRAEVTEPQPQVGTMHHARQRI